MIRKLDNLLINAKVSAAQKMAGFKLKRKANGDETLVIKIMLIVIAVVLITLFRDEISDLITELLADAKTKIQGMYN